MTERESQEAIDLMSEANRLRFERPLEAREFYSKAVCLCRERGSQSMLIKSLKGLGQIERDLGNTLEALALYEEAAQICRVEDDLILLAHTVRHIADINQDLGRADLAEPSYLEALSIYRGHQQTNPLDLANTLRPFALLKESAGETDDAKLLWAEARDLYAAANIAEGVTECSRHLA